MTDPNPDPWTPIADALPPLGDACDWYERTENVLVTLPCGEVAIAYAIRHRLHAEEPWDPWAWVRAGRDGYVIHHDPIAWMPLPEPYRPATPTP